MISIAAKPSSKAEMMRIAKATDSTLTEDQIIAKLGHRHGLGLCQMPLSLVRAHIDDGELNVVLPDRCRAETPFNALWPATRGVLPRVRVVVDELVRRAEAGHL